MADARIRFPIFAGNIVIFLLKKIKIESKDVACSTSYFVDC
jgi:hypothetical protein